MTHCESIPASSRSAVKAAIVLAVGALTGLLIILHTPYLNGPPFWPWPWRTLPPAPTYALLGVAAIPFFLGQWLFARTLKVVPVLCLIMAASFFLRLASVLPFTTPPSLEMVRVIVENPDATSYYTDAAALNSHQSVADWLRQFPDYMPHLSLHSQTKAPGPILYYTAFIRWFGVSGSTALWAGIVLGALATLSIPATYLLLREFTRDAAAAFHGASFLALCPGFVLFFPMFDPLYIVLSCAMVGLWAAALRRDSAPLSIGLGATLAAMSWISFNVLAIGFFMAMYPLIADGGRVRRRALSALRLSAIAIGTWFALLVLFVPISGYDAFSTFASAWRNQHALLDRYGHTRPYPMTIAFDLSDFAMGSGWVSVALVVCYFVSTAKRTDRRLILLCALCIVQLIVVAITGLLQTETARVWNFMLPLLMLPIGLELRGWTAGQRVTAYAALWMVMAAIAQNMKLIY